MAGSAFLCEGSPTGEVELSGEPDGLIATGYREPEAPFFAFVTAELFDIFLTLKALKAIVMQQSTPPV